MTQQHTISQCEASPIENQASIVGSRPAKLPVTVVIPVKNEERNLPRCLARLERFAHIVVVDSGSTDRTKQIALQFDAEVLVFEWNGLYPKKRNWVLLNYRFETPWVFFLDADEYVTSRFCDALSRAIDSSDVVGFWLRYTNHFFGRELRHGVPQRKLSLFKVGTGLYERIDESHWSNLDMEVHEHPVITGKIGEIKEPITHEDYNGLDKFLNKHIQYAKWEANRYRAISSAGGSKFTSRQRIKYRHIDKPWFAWFYFIYAYCVRLGFMDGGPGFMYAFYKLWYFFSIRRMILESRSDPTLDTVS